MTYVLRVTVSKAKLIRSKYGFDIPNCITDANGLHELLSGDPERLCGVAYILAGGEDSIGKSEEAWLDEIDGDALEELRAAVTEAILDFFKDPARRRGIEAVIKEMAITDEMAMDRMIVEMASIDREKLFNEAAEEAKASAHGE